MDVIINPGAMIRGYGNAPDNVAAALARDAKITEMKRTGGPDKDGYFDYVFTTPGGNNATVIIPSISLDRFHQNLPARVYIGGNSWMWKYAVEILLALDDEETG